jgi:hypothetical protein
MVRYTTKREAATAGKALLKRMPGAGWKLRLSKIYNGTWEFAVESGPISVREHGGGYYALVSAVPDVVGYGAMVWGESLCDTDPVVLVQRTLKKVATVVARHQAVLAAIEKAAGQRDTAPVPDDVIQGALEKLAAARQVFEKLKRQRERRR